MIKRLPPYAKPIADARKAGLVPAPEIGWLLICLSWDIAPSRARIVLPPDRPANDFDLSFLAALDLLIVYHRQDAPRVSEVADELLTLPPRTLTACPIDGGTWYYWHEKGQTLLQKGQRASH